MLELLLLHDIIISFVVCHIFRSSLHHELDPEGKTLSVSGSNKILIAITRCHNLLFLLKLGSVATTLIVYISIDHTAGEIDYCGKRRSLWDYGDYGGG